MEKIKFYINDIDFTNKTSEVKIIPPRGYRRLVGIKDIDILMTDIKTIAKYNKYYLDVRDKKDTIIKFEHVDENDVVLESYSFNGEIKFSHAEEHKMGNKNSVDYVYYFIGRKILK